MEAAAELSVLSAKHLEIKMAGAGPGGGRGIGAHVEQRQVAVAPPHTPWLDYLIRDKMRVMDDVSH